MSVERAINNMNAADHTLRAALRQHRLAPPDAAFPRRLKDFADACESQQIACDYASQEGLGWEPLPPARRLPAADEGPASYGRSSTTRGKTSAARLKASASPQWLAPSANSPPPYASCPRQSPKQTGRSHLTYGTAELIAADPLRRQPTFGIVAGTAAPSSRQQPRGLRPRYDESAVFCLTLQPGSRWPLAHGHRLSKRLREHWSPPPPTNPSLLRRTRSLSAHRAPRTCAPAQVVGLRLS
jgi:hypothetical protein